MSTNNAEGLFRRPRSKFWWMRYYAFDPVKGKRIKVQQSTGVTSLRKAKAVRATAVAAVASGKVQPYQAERVRFEDLVELVRADYRTNGKASLDRAERAFKKLEARFGGNKAVEITAKRIDRYLLDRLDDGSARATVFYELRMLRRGFKLAVKRGDLATMPSFPAMGDANNTRSGFFTEADLAALQIELPEHLRGAAEFFYCTGWRKEEAFTLRWENVYWEAEEIWLDVGTTKNKRGRVFQFGNYPRLKAVLEQQRAYTGEWKQLTGQIIPWVFHRQGNRIRSHYAAWRTACRKAGLEGKRVHDFRRSAAREMRLAGIPEHTVMLLCGWKTRSVFQRYDVHSPDDLRDATAKLARPKAKSGTLAYAPTGRTHQ